MVGRYFKTTKGGVPVVPLNRWVHDFPQVDPGRFARITFRWYSFGSAIVMGYMFARATTSSEGRSSNQWYNRPDLKPFPAMVAQPPEVTRDSMLETQYVTQRKSDVKRSALYRFFMARDADFSLKDNPYRKAHPEDVWDSRKAQYSTYTNRFGDHHQ